jgi:hypothetical protein
MRVLVGCEKSGVVRDAFKRLGHDAWSCDLEPTQSPGNHLQCDVLTVLDDDWDLAIFHPECTYLCSAGLHRNHNTPGRPEQTLAALEFVRKLLDAPIPRIALENPVGRIGTQIRPATQFIQPYQFGEDASKRTGLWLKNLPPLQETKRFPGRWVTYNNKLVERWSNQTDSGQNRLGPSETRSADRARTYLGIANAMARQWGNLGPIVG